MKDKFTTMFGQFDEGQPIKNDTPDPVPNPMIREHVQSVIDEWIDKKYWKDEVRTKIVDQIMAGISNPIDYNIQNILELYKRKEEFGSWSWEFHIKALKEHQTLRSQNFAVHEPRTEPNNEQVSNPMIEGEEIAGWRWNKERILDLIGFIKDYGHAEALFQDYLKFCKRPDSTMPMIHSSQPIVKGEGKIANIKYRHVPYRPVE